MPVVTTAKLCLFRRGDYAQADARTWNQSGTEMQSVPKLQAGFPLFTRARRIIPLGVDSPLFSAIVLFKHQPCSLGFGGFLEGFGSLERMGKLPLEFPVPVLTKLKRRDRSNFRGAHSTALAHRKIALTSDANTAKKVAFGCVFLLRVPLLFAVRCLWKPKRKTTI